LLVTSDIQLDEPLTALEKRSGKSPGTGCCEWVIASCSNEPFPLVIVLKDVHTMKYMLKNIECSIFLLIFR